MWGVPVIFGPNNERFQEAQGLKACGAGLEIQGADDFQRIMDDFMQHPAKMKDLGNQAADFVKKMTGAAKRILSDVEPAFTK